MKRLLSTVLLACFVLGAWAQNKTKMTEEEKKEAMKQLEVLYQFETGAAFGELDSLTESQEFKQDYRMTLKTFINNYSSNPLYYFTFVLG